MAKALTTTRASVTVYNLTNNSIKKDGSPPSFTPEDNRTFILRNKINFTNDVGSGRPMIDAKAGASSAGVANIMQLIKVPKRAVVHELILHAPDTVAPTLNDGGTVGASTLLNFSAYAYTSASLSSAVSDLDGFGTVAVNASTFVLTTFPTISASTPWTRSVKVTTVSNASQPTFFKYGGYVEMQLSGGASTSAVTSDVYFSGTLEVQAICSYLPE